MTDETGAALQQVRNIQFGPTITNKDDVEERLRRAQRAVLNPREDWKVYLAGEGSEIDALSFSSNCVSLEIRVRLLYRVTRASTHFI